MASALIYYLQNLEHIVPDGIHEVRLFNDSAASQNKNSTVIAALSG